MIPPIRNCAVYHMAVHSLTRVCVFQRENKQKKKKISLERKRKRPRLVWLLHTRNEPYEARAIRYTDANELGGMSVTGDAAQAPSAGRYSPMTYSPGDTSASMVRWRRSRAIRPPALGPRARRGVPLVRDGAGEFGMVGRGMHGAEPGRGCMAGDAWLVRPMARSVVRVTWWHGG